MCKSMGRSIQYDEINRLNVTLCACLTLRGCVTFLLLLEELLFSSC